MVSRQPILIMNNHANFSIHDWDDTFVILKDMGPWDTHLSITNDAEWVIEQVLYNREIPSITGGGGMNERRLLYLDSENKLTELSYSKNGKFLGFMAWPVKNPRSQVEPADQTDRFDQLIIDEED